VIELVSAPKAVDEDGNEVEAKVPMVELFSIDGTAYSIPDKVRPALSLQYLRIARTQGVGIAEDWLADQLVGAEAYEALLNFPDITAEQITAVMRDARRVAFGETERESGKANGRPASTRPKRTTSRKR
jgi:hypothetical protein